MARQGGNFNEYDDSVVELFDCNKEKVFQKYPNFIHLLPAKTTMPKTFP